MATDSSGDGVEPGGEGGREREGSTCDVCGLRLSTNCDNCNPPSTGPQVYIRKAKTLIFTDCSHGDEGHQTCQLRTSPRGDLYIERAEYVIINQNETTFTLGTRRDQVKVNVASDLEEVKQAPPSVLVLRSDWTNVTEERLQQPEVLLTRMIHEQSEDFFLKVLSRVMAAEVSQEVMTTLYLKFKLRLLGMTKSLEMLMEGEEENVKEIMRSRKEDLWKVLVKLVPEEERRHVTWEKIQNFPMQPDHLPTEVKERSPEEVQGAIDYACKFGSLHTLTNLLRHPFGDIRVLNADGLSPFHLACRHGNSHILDCLLNNGADIHQKDSQGWSPLHHACKPISKKEDGEKEDRRLETVRWLLTQDADVTAVTPEGHKAVDLARMGGHDKVLELLTAEEREGRDDGEDPTTPP